MFRTAWKEAPAPAGISFWTDGHSLPQQLTIDKGLETGVGGGGVSGLTCCG